MSEERKRTIHHNKLKCYLAEVNAHSVNPLSHNAVETMMNRMNDSLKKLEAAQEKLEEDAVGNEAIKVQVEAGLEWDRTYRELCSKLRGLLDIMKPTGLGTSSAASSVHTVKVKLPDMSLPVFSGDNTTWMSFKDLFTSAVASRSELSGATKLNYLKSSLRGEPYNLIEYLQSTDVNYSEAWKILHLRYDNKKEIIRTHTHKLLDLKPVKFENATQLQSLLDDAMKCIRSLNVLGCPTDHWDDLVIAILEKKLDQSTRREWAKIQSGNSPTTFTELVTFLNSHIRGLQAAGNSSSSHVMERRGEKQMKVNHASTEGGTCPFCEDSHHVHQCKEFLNKPTERSAMAKKARLCFNCLRSDHMIKNCTSPRRCKKCGSRHHTLLHQDRSEKMQTTSNEGTPPVSSNHVEADERGLLMTVLVNIADRAGVPQTCRVFVDPGAQGDFITKACSNRLGLVRKTSSVKVTGFGGSAAGSSSGVVNATLVSRLDSGKTMDVKLHIMKRLTGRLPTMMCQRNWRHLDGLNLADPKWYKPGPVDILVGVKYYHKLLLAQRVEGPNEDSPVAWETIFGWGVSGTCPEEHNTPLTSFHIRIDPLEEQLKKFWEVEEPPKKRILTLEEKTCESHFLQTYSRDNSGRFHVSVPFDEEKKKSLGRSRDIGLRRLYQVERRTQKRSELREPHIAFMKEYIDLGHMVEVPPEECGEKLGVTNYLCHHFVTNESSTTTKLRVVFDGSATTTTGVSFNDTVLVGATLQDDLFDLLLRFRLHPVALKADIAKMFRQFQLTEPDQDMHRILWRESPSQPVKEYKLTTVTYGTGYAPNLATRCVVQLGRDCAITHPEASQVLLNDLYVDDNLTGSETEDDAIALFKQLCEAAATAGLEFRKWSSNSKKVMEAIPPELRETNNLVFDDGDTVKALGVQWHPPTDHFKFKQLTFTDTSPITKRLLLSELARVFDPLGLVSCVMLRGKMLLQELWKLSITWDDPVPEATQKQWEEYKVDLENLQLLSIPRRITTTGAVRYELHGFGDSSEQGFGCLVYLRSVLSDGSADVKLVTSKTRVAPVRQVTLPRLELCAAVLLAEVITHVKECLKLECEIVLWSDSMITLTWIAANPRRWNTYVANRVARIQELTKVEWWKHVAGIENPADLASRGCTVSELCNSDFWWKGPSWLVEQTLPTFPQPNCQSMDLEERKVKMAVNVATMIEHPILCRYSSLTKLLRITAWHIRYLSVRITKRSMKGPLLASELQQGLVCWIKVVQQQYFGVDIAHLKRDGHVGPRSQLRTLHPFLDNIGILRLSGRTMKAEIAEESKQQIILPGGSHLTTLLIDDRHERNFHSGFQLTWSTLQTEFWILRGRDKVRHFVRSCVRCRRFRKKVAEQLMGVLPTPRVTLSRPFLHTGVDYAGPFMFKDVVGRAPKVYKGYMCLFVCLSTKALHLEPATALTTEAFVAALRRFVARRGLCAHMYSDNGTNFLGADRELKSFVRKVEVEKSVTSELSNKGITWHFNPPAAPHRGGLWEAGVKSAKTHLRRICGNSPLTFEQWSTLLAQVEAVLNSRPLYAMSPDPSDLQPLTPGHFLIGGPLTAVPDCGWVNIPKNRLSQFQQIQQQFQQFWLRWSRDYLHTLQQRNKWMWEERRVKVGDLVLLVEETPPATWKMGRIVEIHPGDDDIVRLVTVKTATTEFKRVVAKLIPLINND